MVGWGRTLGIIVGGGVGVDLYEPGHIRRGYARRPDVTSFYVGEPQRAHHPARRRRLAAIMNDVDTAKATDNLWGERWTKLCVNAHAQRRLGRHRHGRQRARPARRGAPRLHPRWAARRCGSARQLGYKLGKVGALDPESWRGPHEGDARRAGRDRTADAGRQPTGGGARAYQRPSMAQDMAKGRRTEIELMNGFIAEKGAKAGVPAPTNARITEVVLRVERGELPARPENVLWN